MSQGWLRIPKDASQYAAVSPRTFEGWLKDGLRYVKANGCRLTKPEWIDAYLEKFEINPGHNVDRIVDEICNGFS